MKNKEKNTLIVYEKHEVSCGNFLEKIKIIEIHPDDRSMLPYMQKNPILINVFNKAEKKIYQLLSEENGRKNALIDILRIIEKTLKMVSASIDQDALVCVAEEILKDFYYLNISEINQALNDGWKKLFKKNVDQNIKIQAASIYAWVKQYDYARALAIEEARERENTDFKNKKEQEENEEEKATQENWLKFRKMFDERSQKNKEEEEKKEREPREAIRKLQEKYKNLIEVKKTKAIPMKELQEKYKNLDKE